MNAREEILGAVRRAIRDTPRALEVPTEPVPWSTGDVDLFCERVQDYGAVVHRRTKAAMPRLVAELVTARHIGALGVPVDLPGDVLRSLTSSVTAVVDNGLSAAELDDLDGVLTSSRLGIAATGTIVLDHAAGQGRRALTLVPDYHLCLVDAASIADDVPAALAALVPTRPMTLISGPSATSDIELSRIEGVHGPRTLEVIVLD